MLVAGPFFAQCGAYSIDWQMPIRPRRGQTTQPRVAAKPRTLGSDEATNPSALKEGGQVVQPFQGCWLGTSSFPRVRRSDPGLCYSTPSGLELPSVSF